MLREGVERRLLYWGFDKKGNNTERLETVTGGYTFRGKVSDDTTVPPRWNKLKSAISATSFDEVLEKAAYTWFNRLMAMKILSSNGYETTQLDYLNEETKTPAILERARRGQYAFLNSNEKQRLQAILTDYEKEQEAFAILLIGYCHQHPLLQGIFGSIDDYTELLLPDDILTENGFLYFLNTTDAISEEDYKQVELIGWLYQFYISEKKDEVFAGFKQNKKAEAKDIPAATQIFTPNWIVKYLVQNTLGRTWLDAHPDSDLKSQWQYLVAPTTSDQLVAATTDSRLSTPDSLTFLDPAVGSGHILVEAFDTLYPMYMTEYYSPEEAVESILQNNLFGLDLDLRAVQLAQFAVLLKAAQYSRTVLQGKVLPHIYAMPQHRTFSMEEVALFLGKENAGYVKQLYKCLQTMEQAHNLGSIMVLEPSSEVRKAVEERYQYWQQNPAKNFEEEIVKEVFPAYLPILLILTNKFACIAANPLYMGQKSMNTDLKNYVNEHYHIGKSDLMTVFMEVIPRLTTEHGRFGLINLPSWLFLTSFHELREKYLANYSFESLLHLGRGIFGIDFGSVAFVIHKKLKEHSFGHYFRLHERNFQHIYFEDIRKLFLYSKTNPDYKYDFSLYRDDEGVNEIPEKGTKEGLKLYYPFVKQETFVKIPGSPIAYWVTKKVLDIFENEPSLNTKCVAKVGMDTGDNEKFLRYWPEVNVQNLELGARIDSIKKWFPYNKGGDARKWYGNQILVLNWLNNGAEVKATSNSNLRNLNFQRLESLSWSLLSSSSGISLRYYPSGFFFDNNGRSIFEFKNNKAKILGLLNSKVGRYFLSILNPTMAFQIGDVSNLPFTVNDRYSGQVDLLSAQSIIVSKSDWDSRETSWDFSINPLITQKNKNLEESHISWLQQISKDFFQLHANEEELNRIFIEIYGLQDELTPDVALKDITILQEELDYEALEQIERPYEGKLVPVHTDVVMQQLISYAVGCYMGRYRLDKPGLHIAHPNPTEEELAPYFVTTGTDKHTAFQIDDDAVIPILGSNGNFTDDLLHRIKEFLTIVWGEDTLTANLNFLQQQLGKDLEEYLVKDFWKYHTRMYSKKPIYWLFSSKKGAFQVLVYMHRMNAFTPAKIRSKYLIPHISWLQGQVRDMEKNAASLSKTELKKLDLRRKQLAECEEYDLLLKDVADKQISFDLDDGVTRNYALFKGVVAEIK